MIPNQRGFTIVELLIVIIVIAILAAVTAVAYSGLQERSRQSKIKSDIAMLSKAILTARNQSGKTLYGITGCFRTLHSYNTTCGTNTTTCYSAPNGTDLTTLTNCYTAYNSALDKISQASNIDVRGLLDPYGRPYVIDENEGENVAGSLCTLDMIAVYALPHVQSNTNVMTNKTYIPNSLPTC